MMPDAVLDLVEPAAKDFAAINPGDELVALASLAISARRIADALAPIPDNAACERCRFWFAGVQGDPQHGLCHRRPPIVTGGMMSAVETVRPETLAADVCGDFSAMVVA